MNNDESNRSNQGQGGGFVRRPIPKYNGDKTGAGEYQNQGGYTPRYNSGYGGDKQRDGAQQSSYQNSDRRGGRRAEGAGSGGYNSGGSGYRSGGYGYNRNSNNYNSNDRLIRQNDIIIQLLKEIRDRLPAPPGGASSRSSDAYSSRRSSYSDGGDEGGDFDVSGANDSGMEQPSDDADGNSAEGGEGEDQDRFNSDD